MKIIKLLIKQFLYAAKCLLQIKDWHFYKFPYLNKYKGKKAYIMANGPSMKQTLKDFDDGKVHIDKHSFWVNLGPLNEHFFKIKPMHLCFSDPMFYRDYEPKKEQIRKMYRDLNERVDWGLTIYGCFFSAKEYRKWTDYMQIDNPNIKIVKMNRKYCSELIPSIRHRLYKAGYFMVPDATIANTAIFLALIEGYSEIELYGCDHNQFLEMSVNEDNVLCMRDTHFFDDKELELRPIIKPCDSGTTYWRVHEFLHFCYAQFAYHEMLKQFADYLGARIINCTKGSMIDSYERKRFSCHDECLKS